MQLLSEEDQRPGPWWLGCGLILVMGLMATLLVWAIISLERWDDHTVMPHTETVDSIYEDLVGEEDSILNAVREVLWKLHTICHTLAEQRKVSGEECHPTEWQYNESEDSLQVAKRE